MKKKIKIEGMTCQHCVDKIKSTLENVNGVDLCKAKIGTATVETCLMGPEQVIELEQSIIEAVKESGYMVKSIR